MSGSTPFAPAEIADELQRARHAGRAMLGPATQFFVDGKLYQDDVSFLNFIGRAQAFHIGALDLIERGNPLAAMTVIRSYLETIAASLWLVKHPDDISKLNLGASQGLPIGRVIAEATKALPGLRDVYKVLSDAAHPAGAGAFHTISTDGVNGFTWQSMPRFRTINDARQVLQWVEELCEVATQIVADTVRSRTEAASATGDGEHRGQKF
jgi:hypothetical protein